MLIHEDRGIDAVDRHCGQVVDVIVDHVRLRVTHLVFDCAGLVSTLRLVPITSLDDGADPLALSWINRQVDDAEMVTGSDLIELAAWPHQHFGLPFHRHTGSR